MNCGALLIPKTVSAGVEEGTKAELLATTALARDVP